jgi:ferritin-like metal-binding protein YciE
MAQQKARDLLVVGLRNAHAMEIQARELMERQSERLDDFPQVKSRVRQHLEETNAQIGRLEKCLAGFGESASTIKDMATSFAANMASLGHAAAPDEVLKNTFANNAFEHYEIAAYKSLLALAGRAGASGAAEELERSLAEEEKMAQWIDDNIAEVTLSYLAKEEREAA